MQSLTRDEFLEVLELTGGALDQLQHAGHVALAFGTPMPATPGRYLDLDLVAMAINFGVSRSVRRDISTAIVAGYFHQWASAVGHAETDLNQDFFLAVGGVGWGEGKKGFKLLVVTNGTLEEINNEFSTADVVYVIGANDVTNPAAKTDPQSAIYGMPILDVDKAHTVMVIKRSMAAGFAGIDNPLYYLDKTLMLFGDAKSFVGSIVREIAGGHN